MAQEDQGSREDLRRGEGGGGGGGGGEGSGGGVARELEEVAAEVAAKAKAEVAAEVAAKAKAEGAAGGARKVAREAAIREATQDRRLHALSGPTLLNPGCRTLPGRAAETIRAHWEVCGVQPTAGSGSCACSRPLG